MDGAGSLQSGFVLAALVAAVIFVDRIGGADELVRRLFQVALAATFAFAVISGTSAAIRPPDYPANSSSSSSSSSSSENAELRQFFKDLANRNAAATSIHFGFGVVALLTGVMLLRRRATIALAAVLSGLLLVLFGGVSTTADASAANPLSAFLSAYVGAIGSVVGKGSLAADIARFGVFLAGAIALILFALLKWDRDVPPSLEPSPAA